MFGAELHLVHHTFLNKNSTETYMYIYISQNCQSFRDSVYMYYDTPFSALFDQCTYHAVLKTMKDSWFVLRTAHTDYGYPNWISSYKERANQITTYFVLIECKNTGENSKFRPLVKGAYNFQLLHTFFCTIWPTHLPCGTSSHERFLIPWCLLQRQ